MKLCPTTMYKVWIKLDDAFLRKVQKRDFDSFVFMGPKIPVFDPKSIVIMSGPNFFFTCIWYVHFIDAPVC